MVHIRQKKALRKGIPEKNGEPGGSDEPVKEPWAAETRSTALNRVVHTVNKIPLL
jgi:hypothetical protein